MFLNLAGMVGGGWFVGSSDLAVGADLLVGTSDVAVGALAVGTSGCTGRPVMQSLPSAIYWYAQATALNR